MKQTATATGLVSRFGAFVAERYPFALERALASFAAAGGAAVGVSAEAIDAFRPKLRAALATLTWTVPGGLAETTPGANVETRLGTARLEFAEACDGFLAPPRLCRRQAKAEEWR